MKLSTERIMKLKYELKKLGLDYDDEKTAQAGIAIMRFVISKAEREQHLQMEIQYGKEKHGTVQK